METNNQQKTTTGFQRISSWEVYSGTIRKAPLNKAPLYAYYSGSILSEARWPDTSVIKNTRGTRTSLSSPNLLGVSSLVGSKVTVQNTAWSFETRRVVGHTNDTISLDSPLSVDPQNFGWGFWFTGNLSFLTQPNEWFYDSVNKLIYINSNFPSEVDFAVDDYLWYTSYNGNNQVRFNEAFTGAKKAAVRIECGKDNGVDSCVVKNAYIGVQITHNPGQVPSIGNFVKNSTITDCYESAIKSMGEGAVITGNVISNIGVIPGLGTDTWGYIALSSSSGKGNNVSYNKMDRLGYIGIVGASDDHIHHNIIKNWCVTLNDGGAIALDHSRGMVIEKNTMTVTESTVFPSCPDEYHGCSVRRKGIYKGENSIQNLTVRDNIVVGAQGPGYFGDNSLDSDGDLITRNVFINCNEGFSHSDWGNRTQANGGSSIRTKYNHKVENNVIFIKPGSNSIVSRHINAHTPIIDYGVSDNNIIYCDDPNSKLFIRNGIKYTLSEWRDLTGKELNTIVLPYEDPLVITNSDREDKVFTLEGNYKTPWGVKYSGTFILPSFESVVLVRDGVTTQPPIPPVPPPTPTEPTNPPVPPPTPTEPTNPPVPPSTLKIVWSSTFSGKNGCVLVPRTGMGSKIQQLTKWACGKIERGTISTSPCTSYQSNIPAKRIILFGVTFNNWSDYGWLNSAVRTRLNGNLENLNGKVIANISKGVKYKQLVLDLPDGTTLKSVIGPSNLNTCGGASMTIESIEIYN